MTVKSCSICGVELPIGRRGRPREICGAPDCVRAAATDRQRKRRWSAAGLPRQSNLAAGLPRGGRYPLLRRIAVRIAEISWPDVDLGEEDLQAIEGYVTMFGSDGVSWVRHVYPWAPSPDLKAMLDDRRRWLYEVTPTQTKRLYGIAERQWQANPYYRPPRYQAQQPPTVVIVGEID